MSMQCLNFKESKGGILSLHTLLLVLAFSLCCSLTLVGVRCDSAAFFPFSHVWDLGLCLVGASPY